MRERATGQDDGGLIITILLLGEGLLALAAMAAALLL